MGRKQKVGACNPQDEGNLHERRSSKENIEGEDRRKHDKNGYMFVSYERGGKEDTSDGKLRVLKKEKNEKKRSKKEKLLDNKRYTNVKIGFININGINSTKIQDLEEEWKEEKLEIIGMVETHIKGEFKWEGEFFVLEGKGRKMNSKKGGGIGIMIRKDEGWSGERVNISQEWENDDVLVSRIKNKKYKNEQLIIIICYMTTGNNQEAIRENKEKYKTVSKVLEDYKEYEVIVMGDMNAHIGILGERVDKQGELLLKLADERDLEIANVTRAAGEVTWERPNNEEKSAIDYILLNDKARIKLSKMEVDENRRIENHSDHNMIILDYEWSNRQGKLVERDSKRTMKRKWKRKNVNWVRFREEIQSRGMIQGNTKEQMHESLMRRLRHIGEKNIGYVNNRFCKKYRPWWNENIKNKRVERKRLNKEFRKLKMRRTRGEAVDEVEFERAKRAYEIKKLETKVEIEKAMRTEEKRKVEELNNKKSNREWWKYIKGPQIVKEEDKIQMNIGGEITEDKEKIKEHIKRYWEGIKGRVGSDNIAMTVRMERSQIEAEQDYEITIIDIKNYLRKLKKLKAVGPDGIPNEFYTEGGEVVEQALERIFKEILRTETVIQGWKQTRVNLIHKGGGKNKCEVKNYRPVAVANTITNIFCGILKEKLTRILEEGKVIGEEQSGFRKDRRGTDNLFVMKEIIEHAKKNKRQYYVAFLDIEKAYDTVNREVMWEIMKRAGIEEKIIRVLKSLYTDTVDVFYLGDLEIDEVKSERGLRQGCTLSPLLFSLYLEEFTRRVKGTGLGIKIGEDLLTLLLFADDIILVAESPEDLQKLLKEVEVFSKDVKMKFSTEKSKIMIINQDQEERVNFKWKMNENELEIVQEYKYLGIKVENKGLKKEENSLRAKAEKQMGILKASSTFRINKYEITRGIWKGVAVPTILYGIEVFEVNARDCQGLETVQNRAARLGLGANRYAPSETLRGEMGWSSFGERINKAKIKYFSRLKYMEETRWAKKIMRWRQENSKMISDYRRRAERLNIYPNERERMIQIDLEGDRNIVRRVQGEVNPERKIMKEVDKKIRRDGLNKWRENIRNKPSLRRYANKVKPRRERFYDGSWESKIFFKARTNSLEIRERKNRWTGEDKYCEYCTERGEREIENLEHLIIECPKYEIEREEMIRRIVTKIGREKWEEIKEEEDGLRHLLGFTEEIGDLVGVTKNFLGKVWKRYQENGRGDGRQGRNRIREVGEEHNYG